VDVLLEAARLMSSDSHVVLAGAPVIDDGMCDDLPSNVTSVGWVNAGQLQWLFSEADILVVPSRWEGFGLVAAEAMRAGVAIVASNVGGLREVVVHGETGYLIQSESPVAIVEAVREVDASKMERMGEAGRKRVKDLFSMPRVHKELSELYSSLVHL
jgi:glycosyltransferase involved in cell wall biosynthesis